MNKSDNRPALDEVMLAMDVVDTCGAMKMSPCGSWLKTAEMTTSRKDCAICMKAKGSPFLTAFLKRASSSERKPLYL